MDRSGMVAIISDKNGISQVAAKKILGDVLDAIKTSVVSGDEVIFRGFGKFYLAKRAAKPGVNPQTLEKVKIPAAKGMKFKASKKLRSL